MQGVTGDSTAPEASGSDSLEAEVLSHVNSLYGAALRLRRKPADTEDLVQDTSSRGVQVRRAIRAGQGVAAHDFA